jgi:GTP-binding protein
MTRRVAIIGRPNVGKSTLFNRLTGGRRAIVHDMPGVTRDRLEGSARLFDLEFKVFDTAGLEPGAKEALADRLSALTLAGLARADVGLFLVDARAGITPLDEEIARLLRQHSKPVILVANKCETSAASVEAQAAWSLGLGPPIAISAEHGLGLETLAEALQPYVGRALAGAEASADVRVEEPDDGLLRLAIIGRPNVGKSSLVNRLINEDRLLTGPEPGLTRDAVGIEWQWRGRRLQLVDTAGLRRKTRIEAPIEKLSAAASLRAIRSCDAAVLLVDATMPLEKQELTIANRVLDEGRALVLAANKWDLVEQPAETLAEIRHRLKHRLAQLKNLPLVTLSVKTGRGVDKLLPTVFEAVDRWSTRISTGKLNRWLAAAVEKNPPPMAQNRRIKIRYATQVGARPPTIALFTNKPETALPGAYLRYLEASFVEAFGLGGIAVRLLIRHGENPYHEART